MITILGATGNVGGKIADELLKTEERVRLVARSVADLRKKVGRRSDAMAGDALDTEFLVKAFAGSDSVFALIPPNPSADDFMAYADAIGSSIVRALEIARIGHVVNLSSIGADLQAGTGPIAALHRQEERLNRIPRISVVHLRSGYFMENLLANLNLMRTKGIASGIIRGDARIPLIATRDIAFYAAQRLANRDFKGSRVQYLLGPKDLTLNQASMTIGIKIGKPNLTYQALSPEEAGKIMVDSGLSRDVSRLYIEMGRAFNAGVIRAPRRAESTTPTDLDTFCREYLVPAYHGKAA